MLKVLIVDDETLVRRGIMTEVDWEGLGYSIIGEAANGLEGLEIAERLSPDLIISDIRMPKMDGIEMVRKLREGGSDVQVIFLTAYSDFSYAQSAIKLFAADYLLKPFEDGELEAAVSRIREKLEGEQKPVKKQENEALARILAKNPSRYVKEALNFIEKNVSNNELSVGMIADSIGISEGHLGRTFRQETEVTVAAFITEYRMCEAKRLLNDHRNRVYEVASLVGYKDITYFTTTFKKHVKMTPTEYQNRK